MKGGKNLSNEYVRPEVLATYTEEELAEEAAVCVATYIGLPPPP
jgi:hypothetical protein